MAQKKKSTALSSISLEIDTTEQAEVTTPSNPATQPATPEKEKETQNYPLVLPKSYHKRLKIYAATEDTSIQKSIIQAIDLFFAEKGI